LKELSVGERTSLIPPAASKKKEKKKTTKTEMKRDR